MFRRIFALLLCIAMLMTGVACRENGPGNGQADPPQTEDNEPPPPPPEFPVVVGGTTVASRPGRVVSLSPALTEKIFDLGLESRLVGVSDFCDYPAGALGLDACGTAQLPDIYTISRLRAHLVLSEIPLFPDDMDELSRLNINVVIIPRAQSLNELWNSYIALARMFEGEHAGQHMGDMFADIVGAWLESLGEAVRNEMHADEDSPGAPYALYLRMLPFTVATGDTLESDLMQLIGLINIAADQSGWHYPEELAAGYSLEEFQAVQILIFDENYITPEDLSENEFFGALPAVTSESYMIIDSAVMERQSLRTFEQLLDMARYVWPEADFPRWPPRIAFTLH